MKITYDPGKKEATLKARGLDFARAEAVFTGPTYSAEDMRRAYGEKRIITVGLLDGRMVVIGWTPRGESRHVSSMRKPMSASKASISTDWSRADAYENTPADYEELPELDDAFFERAERGQGIGGCPVPFLANPEETARIARLRDAIADILGRSAYDVKGLKRAQDGRLLLLLEPIQAADD